MVGNVYFDTQIRPYSVAETSIYETLHISVIITSKNEDNVYKGIPLKTVEERNGGTPLQALKKQGDGVSDRLGKAERSRLPV